MSLGPVELVTIQFDHTDLQGEVLTELQRLVDARAVRVVDVLFAVRYGDDPVRFMELTELEDTVRGRIQPIVEEVTGLVRDEDARFLSADLGPDSALAVLVLEQSWIAGITEAAGRAGASVIMAERIPRSIIEQALAEQSA